MAQKYLAGKYVRYSLSLLLPVQGVNGGLELLPAGINRLL